MKRIRLMTLGLGMTLALGLVPQAHAWSNWSVGVRIGGPCYRPWCGYGWGCYRPYSAVYIGVPPIVVGAPVVAAPVVVGVPVVAAPVVVQSPPPPPTSSNAPPAEEVAPQPRPVPAPATPQPAPAPLPLQPVSAHPQADRQAQINQCLQLLGNADEGARLGGVTELGRLKAHRAVDPLAATLAGDRSPIVREAAARALGLIGAPKALPALRRAALSDSDHDVRRSAQFAAEVIQSR
jgi:hypothetical protein